MLIDDRSPIIDHHRSIDLEAEARARMARRKRARARGAKREAARGAMRAEPAWNSRSWKHTDCAITTTTGPRRAARAARRAAVAAALAGAQRRSVAARYIHTAAPAGRVKATPEGRDFAGVRVRGDPRE